MPAGVKFVTLDASDASNLAIDSHGRVWAWGDNYYGILGDGSTHPSATPVMVRRLRHVVLTDTGNSDAVALESNGTVWAWGNNVEGQLCDGHKGGYVTIPQEIASLSRRPHGVSVTSVAAGGNKVVFLLSNGTVMTCGSNEDGELGSGSRRSYTDQPVQVAAASDRHAVLHNVVAITSGNLFVGALTSDGTVVDWGNNAFGQLGDGTTARSSIPVRVKRLRNVREISYGGDLPANGHAMALLAGGGIADWGSNAYGQLGTGSTKKSLVPVRLRVTDGTSDRVISVAAGGTHSMALLSDGNLMVWGDNASGQLGNGTTTRSLVPIRVRALGKHNASFISAGANESLVALKPASGRGS